MTLDARLIKMLEANIQLNTKELKPKPTARTVRAIKPAVATAPKHTVAELHQISLDRLAKKGVTELSDGVYKGSEANQRIVAEAVNRVYGAEACAEYLRTITSGDPSTYTVRTGFGWRSVGRIPAKGQTALCRINKGRKAVFHINQLDGSQPVVTTKRTKAVKAVELPIAEASRLDKLESAVSQILALLSK